MQTQIITREQVIELVKKMPLEKLVSWYEYGLFIQARPTFTPLQDSATEAELQLLDELAEWEAASDEDWLKLEESLTEVA